MTSHELVTIIDLTGSDDDMIPETSSEALVFQFLVREDRGGEVKIVFFVKFVRYAQDPSVLLLVFHYTDSTYMFSPVVIAFSVVHNKKDTYVYSL